MHEEHGVACRYRLEGVAQAEGGLRDEEAAGAEGGVGQDRRELGEVRSA